MVELSLYVRVLDNGVSAKEMQAMSNSGLQKLLLKKFHCLSDPRGYVFQEAQAVEKAIQMNALGQRNCLV